MKVKRINKAIIPVAGFGTRFLPITKVLPKAMLPIVDKPAIHYLIEEVVTSGIEEVIIIVGPEQKIIQRYFEGSKELEKHLAKNDKTDVIEALKKISELAKITYITQNKALGLGHALYCARKLLQKEEAFAVLLGDDLLGFEKKSLLTELLRVYEEYQGSTLAVQRVPDQEISNYGAIKGQQVTESVIRVLDMVEKPPIGEAPSNMAIMGRYILPTEVLKMLGQTKPGSGGEIQLTDAIRKLNKKRQVYAYMFNGKRYDIGSKLGYLQANIDFALQREDLNLELEKHIRDGLAYKK